MAIDLNSSSFPEGMFSNLLSMAEWGYPRFSHQPNDFLARFSLMKTPGTSLTYQELGILGKIGKYTQGLYKAENIEQRAQSLIFPNQPITLETQTKHHPDSSLALGACLLYCQ